MINFLKKYKLFSFLFALLFFSSTFYVNAQTPSGYGSGTPTEQSPLRMLNANTAVGKVSNLNLGTVLFPYGDIYANVLHISAISLTGDLDLGDDNKITFGDSEDYWNVYNSTGTQYELWGTDVDGGGTDGLIMSVDDGTDDVDFTGDAVAPHFIGALTGNADTATALAANGADCSAGNSPIGVDASGAVESCFDVWTEAENTAAGYLANVAEDLSPELGASLDVLAYDLLHVDSVFGSTSILPVRIGDAGTSSATLNSEDDLEVTGDLGVVGIGYFDEDIIIADQKNLALGGTGLDTVLRWSTAQTPDGTLMALGEDNRTMVITEYTDRNTDFAKAQSTNPQVCIHSADATDLTQDICLSHDQTNGVIDTGTGGISMADQVLGVNGTSANPSYGFSEDVDSGMYLYTDGQVILETAGATNLLMTTTDNFSYKNFSPASDNSTNFGSSLLTWGESHVQDAYVYDTLTTGQFTFAEDAGFPTWADMSVSATPAAGTQMSYTAKIDGEYFMKMYSEADSSGGIQNPNVSIYKPLVRVPSQTQVLVAGTALTITNPLMRIDSGAGGAVTMTATPTIADSADGSCVIIQGDDDTNTITFQDESNLADSGLQLAGGNDFTFGAGDTLHVCYDLGDDNWYEVGRSDN